MNFLSIYSLPPLISSILFLFLGVVVIRNNKKSNLDASFLALCATTFVWQFVMFLLFNTSDPTIARIFVRLAHVGIIFLAVCIYHFVVILVGRKTALDKYLLFINYIAAIAFEFSLFSNLLINDYYEYFWSFYPRAGILHPLYLLVLFITSLRTFYLLLITLNSEKEFSNSRYYQIKYVCWATFFYLFASSDFLLNYGVEFYPIGFLFILVFMGITAYAMIRHRLMDIKIVLKHSSVYVLSFLIISFLAVFFNYFNKPDSGIFLEANIVIVIILVILFPYVKKYLYRLANKYFFTSLYDSNKIISDLSFRLRSTLELDYMYESIYDCADSAFHPESFGFLIYDSEKNLYSFKYKQGKFKNIPDSFKGSFKLHQHYTKKNKVALSSELQNSDDLSFSAIGKVFEKLNIEVLVPVNIKWRNIGLLVLGRKQTRDIYTNQDVELLEIIGGLGATAIENGDLYKNISAKNEELENLLKVKTDFLRIANHQLNTPLSIMKLAYASVDEKTYSVEEGFLMAREGLNRLSSVVSQLWIVLDIESGSLYLRSEIVDLIDLYNEVLQEKRGLSQIKNKGLKIVFKFSKEQKHLVFVSRQKIKEVFSALFENAIGYTKKGSVSVNVDIVEAEGRQFVKTIITDTGVGIDSEDGKIIFEKFSRGRQAALLHPDGSGIGLYISKHIIEASGGSIKLESTTEGQGSVFSFTLPVHKDDKI